MSRVVCYFWIIFCYTLVNKNDYHTMCQSVFNIITFVLRTSGHQHLISSSDRQGQNFASCVWRTVSSHSAYHPQRVFLAQFSLYVHKGGIKPHSLSWWSECKLTNSPLCYISLLTNFPSFHSDCNADWEISHDNLNQNSRICQSTMGIWIQIDQSGRSKMMIWIQIEQSANLPWWSESWLFILPIYYGDLNPDLLTSLPIYYDDLNPDWSIYHDDLNPDWSIYHDDLNPDWSIYHDDLNPDWSIYHDDLNTDWSIYHDDLNLSISGSNHNPDWLICWLARVISTRLLICQFPLVIWIQIYQSDITQWLSDASLNNLSIFHSNDPYSK